VKNDLNDVNQVPHDGGGRLNDQANEAKKPPKPVGRRELSRQIAECVAKATPDQLQAMADELRNWALEQEIVAGHGDPVAGREIIAAIAAGIACPIERCYCVPGRKPRNTILRGWA
jgi:hypothetical protein